MPRLRRVDSPSDLDAAVDEYRFRGYRVLRHGRDSVLMQRVDRGTIPAHIVLIMFTAWWTFGIGNLLYAWICQSRADQVLIRIEDD